MVRRGVFIKKIKFKENKQKISIYLLKTFKVKIEFLNTLDA